MHWLGIPPKAQNRTEAQSPEARRSHFDFAINVWWMKCLTQ